MRQEGRRPRLREWSLEVLIVVSFFLFHVFRVNTFTLHTLVVLYKGVR